MNENLGHRVQAMVIKSHICRDLPGNVSSPANWVRLHHNHVLRLKSAWGALISHFELDAVMIHSGKSALKHSRDDQYWPMAVTPHFSHWTPYTETPALLYLTKENRPKLFFETHSSYWEGPGPACNHWDVDSFDIEYVNDLSSIKLGGVTAFLGDDNRLAARLGIPPEQINRQDIYAVADYFRTLKSDFEVASICAATVTAAQGHSRLRDMFLSGDFSEIELHHAYLQTTQQTDFSVPYGNIVGLGSNAGILHHVHYGRTRVSGPTSLLVDAGATMHGYASDITRTWVRGDGGGASLFRRLVQGLDEVQKILVGEFKIGRSYEDLHNKSHDLLAELLMESKLVDGSRESIVESGISRLFFPHGLGHSLGIQVHDVGMKPKAPASHNPYLRNTSMIEAGQVVTIEPGLYFIPALMKELQSGPKAKIVDQKMLSLLMPFGGIRIEDNILATDKGPINLTRPWI